MKLVFQVLGRNFNFLFDRVALPDMRDGRVVGSATYEEASFSSNRNRVRQ